MTSQESGRLVTRLGAPAGRSLSLLHSQLSSSCSSCALPCMCKQPTVRDRLADCSPRCPQDWSGRSHTTQPSLCSVWLGWWQAARPPWLSSYNNTLTKFKTAAIAPAAWSVGKEHSQAFPCSSSHIERAALLSQASVCETPTLLTTSLTVVSLALSTLHLAFFAIALGCQVVINLVLL